VFGVLGLISSRLVKHVGDHLESGVTCHLGGVHIFEIGPHFMFKYLMKILPGFASLKIHADLLLDIMVLF
jgi:hypothetical protein